MFNDKIFIYIYIIKTQLYVALKTFRKYYKMLDYVFSYVFFSHFLFELIYIKVIFNKYNVYILRLDMKCDSYSYKMLIIYYHISGKKG